VKVSLAFLALFLVGALCAQEPTQPFRRPLSPPVFGGWTQVRLDQDAQLHAETAWIGDAEGRPVPFLRENEAAAKDLALLVRDFSAGRDDAGRVLVEFALARSDGLPVAQRESSRLVAPNAFGIIFDTRKEMTIALDVDATGPWAADVQVAFDQFGQGWANESEPRQVYDFGANERRLELKVRRIAPKWRLRLTALRGEIRGVRAVTVRAEGLPSRLDERGSSLGVVRHSDHWTLTLPNAPQRVLAVQLHLKGTVAPVRAELWRLEDEPRRAEERATWAGSGLVWEMPGLNSRAGEVRLSTPLLAERFRLKLPEGVEVASAEVTTAGESLWFVAQKGELYYLHLAGQKQVAPGDLAALPAVLDGELPDYLGIGKPEADPFGKPLREDISVVVRRWLPWAVAVAVAVLAGFALRMMQSRAGEKKPAA
jgi:hypothetical protein